MHAICHLCVLTLSHHIIRSTNLIVSKGFRLQGGHMNLFITFALLTKRAIWELATFVGHEMATLSEGQVFKVQKLSRRH